MSWFFQPLLPAGAEIESTPPSGDLFIKYWTGTEWAQKPIKYWNGTNWVSITTELKYWSGVSWVQVT